MAPSQSCDFSGSSISRTIGRVPHNIRHGFDCSSHDNVTSMRIVSAIVNQMNATTIGRMEVNDDAGRGYATLGAAAKLPELHSNT